MGGESSFGFVLRVELDSDVSVVAFDELISHRPREPALFQYLLCCKQYRQRGYLFRELVLQYTLHSTARPSHIHIYESHIIFARSFTVSKSILLIVAILTSLGFSLEAQAATKDQHIFIGCGKYPNEKSYRVDQITVKDGELILQDLKDWRRNSYETIAVVKMDQCKIIPATTQGGVGH